MTALYPPASVGVDALLLANAAEVPPNGLLYIQGGGWSRCWPPEGSDYPYERPLPIVAIFRVPWNETNRVHNFELNVEDGDNVRLAAMGGNFNAGRQPDLTVGASQLVVVAVPLVVRLPKPGLYSVVAVVDGAEARRIEFEAIREPGRLPAN